MLGHLGHCQAGLSTQPVLVSQYKTLPREKDVFTTNMHRVRTFVTSPLPLRLFHRNCLEAKHHVARVGRCPRTFATQAALEPFLNGSSSVYVEEMYLEWQKNPNNVHKVRPWLCEYSNSIPVLLSLTKFNEIFLMNLA